MGSGLTAPPSTDDEDPLAPVMALGGRAVRVGIAIGFTLALAAHAWPSARALTALYDMQRVTRAEREVLHDFFWATVDVDAEKAPPPPDPKVEDVRPPPEPEPEPEPAPKAPAPTPEKEVYDQPPAPAKAAAVLTRPDSPNDKIEDMTDRIVTGDGTVTNGMISANGVGDQAVTSPHARVGGVIGGVGTGAPTPAAPPPPTGPDLSRPPGLVGGGNWNCPFPPEADGDGIDRADVVINVTVRADGSPGAVSVKSDPGHGFGRAARICALGRRFSPALDRAGQPITMSTPATVHFKR